MTLTLAVASVFLMSIYKPLLMAVVLLGWARWATSLDKDAAYFFLPRRMLNTLTLAAGLVAFGLWLLIPWFWVGLILAILIIIGASVTYAMIRNPNVPEGERWTLSTEVLTELLLQRRQQTAMKQARLRFVHHASRSASDFKPVPLPEDANYNSHIKLEELLADAIVKHAQKIEILVSGNNATLQLSIDGVSYKQTAPPGKETLSMIDYLKGECGMDVADHRKKQHGHCRFDAAELGQHEARVHVAGSTRGISCIVDMDPRKQLGITFDNLGLLPVQYDQLKPVLVEAEGLVIVATPPDQGRTSTLYALIQQHDPYLLDIHTLEHPIEMEVEGVTPHEPVDGNWAKTLNSLLLRDPTVMMVAQVPDPDTAKLATQAAAERKRIYAGLRADDTFAAIKVWAKAVGDLTVMGDGLRAVISQRLIRKLCPACRQPYKPDAGALRKLNLPADKISQLYKSSGKIVEGSHEEICPTCNGLGYLGRTAAFEVIVLDATGKNFLRAGDLAGLRAHVRKNKMLWLQEAAMAKVVNGETSVTEVMRALGNPENLQKSRSDATPEQ